MNDCDLQKINRTILNYAKDINCAASSVVMQLAKDLHEAIYKKDVLLKSFNKVNLISHVRLKFGPSFEYL